ncbi:hypothetical protein B0F90DRAFT_737023 [Multifurca ochricompacta]|uniref:Uncharacterized protein n=1 Tax=Multifurca ochricompacta TaxID=376703 RepID=A0AAD4QNZ2_9AGAM|nr:hypothetical protein B0F90DRAFT_737023 [Multifurca ochricompacta]
MRGTSDDNIQLARNLIYNTRGTVNQLTQTQSHRPSPKIPFKPNMRSPHLRYIETVPCALTEQRNRFILRNMLSWRCHRRLDPESRTDTEMITRRPVRPFYPVVSGLPPFPSTMRFVSKQVVCDCRKEAQRSAAGRLTRSPRSHLVYFNRSNQGVRIASSAVTKKVGECGGEEPRGVVSEV